MPELVISDMYACSFAGGDNKVLPEYLFKILPGYVHKKKDAPDAVVGSIQFRS